MMISDGHRSFSVEKQKLKIAYKSSISNHNWIKTEHFDNLNQTEAPFFEKPKRTKKWQANSAHHWVAMTM